MIELWELITVCVITGVIWIIIGIVWVLDRRDNRRF